MPDYKTGSYIIQAAKEWNCEGCGGLIARPMVHFVRIQEYGEELKRTDGKVYHKKIYHRYHFRCAMKIINLNGYEKSLLSRSREG